MNKRFSVIICSASLVVIILLICIPFLSENKNEYQPDTVSIDRYQLDTASIDQFTSMYYGGENEIVYESAETIVDYLNMAGNVKAVTIPVAWNIVEPEKGNISFDMYKPIIDTIVSNGFKLIIIIDAEGRAILKDGIEIDRSIPDWVWEEYPDSVALDFEGNPTGTFDYCSDETLDITTQFYNRTIAWFDENYGEHIEGFSPGIMGEGEIKFSQTGFRWQTYSERAQESFRVFLQNKYGDISALNDKMDTDYNSYQEISMPVINYNNTVVSPNIGESMLYTELMIFREDAIVNYVSTFTDVIHSNNYPTIGYFGQFMFPLDAIYATGVVSKCSDIFDIAVIDYNFFDGYKPDYNTVIPAYLTNLVSNLGYKKVYTGLYFERISLNDSAQFVSEVNNNIIADAHSDGLEIGSLTNNTKDTVTFTSPTYKKSEKSKIALYTSEWNYYKTHGENEIYQNYLSDSAVELFSMLEFELDIPVEVITDKNVLEGDLKDFSLVLLPTQMFVASEVKKQITEYGLQGGNLIQDFRFGEFDEYGKPTGDWGNEVFRIGALQAGSDEIVIDPDEYNIRLFTIYNDLPVYYEIYGMDSVGNSITCSELYKSEGGKVNSIGLKTDHSIVWAFQPQLYYEKTRDPRYLSLVENSIYSLVDKKSLTGKTEALKSAG